MIRYAVQRQLPFAEGVWLGNGREEPSPGLRARLSRKRESEVRKLFPIDPLIVPLPIA